MPGTVLRDLRVITQPVLTTTLRNRHDYILHIIAENENLSTLLKLLNSHS